MRAVRLRNRHASIAGRVRGDAPRALAVATRLARNPVAALKAATRETRQPSDAGRAFETAGVARQRAFSRQSATTYPRCSAVRQQPDARSSRRDDGIGSIVRV